MKTEFKIPLSVRRKMSSSHLGIPLSLEHRSSISLALQNRFFSSAHKKKIRLAKLGTRLSEETRIKMSIAKKGCIPWNKGGTLTKEHREKIGLGGMGRKHSKETKRKMKLAQKGKKLTPQHLRNILKAVCSRPNKFEIRALVYLESIYPKRFSYTGDGSCIINGKSADAIDLKTRTVALFNGKYYHLGIHGLSINDHNKRKRERIEAKPFTDVGYKVIFIWEDEINKLKLEDLHGQH